MRKKSLLFNCFSLPLLFLVVLLKTTSTFGANKIDFPEARAELHSSSYYSASENTHEHIHIEVGSEPDYPPFCFVNDQGQADGFSVELLKAVVAKVGLKLSIKVDTWSNLKRDLAEGRLDVLPLVGQTPERAPLYDFSPAYFIMHGAIFVREGDVAKIKKLSDLKDKKILVMEGDNAEEFLIRQAYKDNCIRTQTFSEAFEKLSAGEGDAVVTQLFMGLSLLEKLGIKNIVPVENRDLNMEQAFCFAVRKGNHHLLAHLNEGLLLAQSDGTYDRLHKKWFSKLYEKAKERERIEELVLVTAIGLTLLFLIWWLNNLRLKERRALQKLEESEEKYKFLYNEIDAAIFTANAKTGIISNCNKAAARLVERDKEELIGQHQSILHPPEQLLEHGFSSGFLEHRKRKSEYSSEDQVITKKGEIKDVIIKSHTIILNGEEYLKAVFHDVSEEKKIFKKNQEQKDFLESVIRSLTNPFAVIDANSHEIILANKLYGKEWKGRKCFEISHNSESPCSLDEGGCECPLVPIKKLKKPVTSLHQHFVNGALRYIEIHAHPVFDEKGEVIQIIESCLDITDRVKAEENFKNSQAQLFQMSKLATLGEMSTGLAHEINQPLSAISLTITYLKKMLERDKITMEGLGEDLKSMEASIKRISKIIEHVRQFARQESQVFAPTDVKATVESALTLLGEQLRRQAIPIETHFAENIPMIEGEPFQLEQIWLNLISNARDSLMEKRTEHPDFLPKLKISIEHDAKHVTLCFSDNGKGMTREVRLKAFEPFFTTKGVGKGTGLGLSISYGIIKSHGGGVEIDTNPEGGVSFVVVFPISPALDGLFARDNRNTNGS